MQRFEAFRDEILQKISPTKADRTRIKSIVEELKRKVILACAAKGVKATVRIEGSVAKDTWLKQNPEIDIFMRLPTTVSSSSLGQISLDIARKATEGTRQIERFADHPYLETFINDIRVNIVPCYNVKLGEWLSATDRTPFHTDYIKKCLKKPLADEVRLLKSFLQGINAYGAEIKIGGFSGYLCELLIVHHKSFIETLRTFATYKKRIVLDIERYYRGREKELKLLFPDQLVIIDPVDKSRNVASAVQQEKLYALVAAARAFLNAANMKFFFPPKVITPSAEALKNKLDNRGYSLIFLILENIEAVPDVLWGQLYKTKRALRKLVELHDFVVLRDAVWSNEMALSVFVFKIEQQVLPSFKKHLGPPLQREKECDNFLSKYAHNENALSGPFIEGNRWVVELRRKFTDVVELLKEKLQYGGRNIGVAELISRAFRKKIEILVNNEVVQLYKFNEKFAEFLAVFLLDKPFWLNTAKTES